MTKEKIGNTIRKLFKCQFAINVYIAFCINFLMEFCGRGTVNEVIKYMAESPLVFLFNMALILLSLSIVFLTRYRVFLSVLISTLWLAIGLTNGIMLSYRVTPFTVVDLTLIKSALTIMGKYMSMTQQMLLYAGIFLVVVLLVFVFLKAPKYKGTLRWRRNLIGIMIAVFSFFFLTKAVLSAGIVARYFGNIANAYKDYGVPYCFTVTFVDRGIRVPPNYTEKAVKEAANKKLPGKKSPIAIRKGTKREKPNIIFVQLESFFDPNTMKGLKFSEDPVPNFRKLKKNFSTGYLDVPVVGAGTCNTEFEVITGMNMDFFGPGEYPYKSVMKKRTAESLAYNLKEIGYSAHAIHNNNGNFYGRNNVFSRMGFDTFTSIEYMNNITWNPVEWSKDEILTGEIKNALNSTDGPDMIYTISVQGHGNYPSAKPETPYPISIKGIEEEGRKNAFEYYASQIKEMDDFIGELTDMLENMNEKTMLVLYGDHLPSLSIKEEELKCNDIYKTQYVIWDNFNLPKENRELQAYQLSAAVLSKAGISQGTMFQYHQRNMGAKSNLYFRNMKLLQYDMLYGKRYLYDETNPYERVKIKMGINNIYVSDVKQEGDSTFIIGNHFTEYSCIFVNDKEVETKFINERTLEAPLATLEDQDVITVCQRGKRDKVLSRTREFIYSKPE